MNHNLYAAFAAGFSRRLEQPCLILTDGRAWTYGDIERASARMANLLVRLGLRRGDRIAMQTDKSPEALVLYLASLRAGMVFLPLNPAYQAQEVEYFLNDAQPGLFVCRPQFREAALLLAAQSGVAHTLVLDENGRGSLIDLAAAQSDIFETVQSGPEELAAILYTSGTTGRSKGAMLSHRNLLSNAETLCREWRFTPADVLLHMLPIFHIHGLFVACHCTLLAGSAMLFEPRFDVRRAIEALPDATMFMGVPTYYTRLLAEPGFTRKCARGIRLFVSGSAPLLAETFTAFAQRTGQRILERYGMTEGGMYTSNPYAGDRRCGSVGPALPGVELRVVDDAGRPCGAGVPGHIQVRGENVFSGYWRMPEKTAEEFTDDGFFRTGDIGHLDKDGYLFISGRARDLIISGGLNIYPKEIEDVIDALPGVAESAVIGLPHADFGEAVTAVVIGERGAQLSADAIAAAVRERLAAFKVPKRVFIAADLPRNAMGKVQKNLLREQYAHRQAGAPAGCSKPE
ncbi:MAG: malonyl-CoA synthase [Rhodocyclaceae bacterium]|nr:malonyl-CoA synthase [Rhodocyclaceae bacterium]